MIGKSMFLSIQALHEQGEAKRAIAKRQDLDVRTGWRYLKQIRREAREPRRSWGASKLDRFQPLIERKVDEGQSATQIYQDLCAVGGVRRPLPDGPPAGPETPAAIGNWKRPPTGFQAVWPGRGGIP